MGFIARNTIGCLSTKDKRLSELRLDDSTYVVKGRRLRTLHAIVCLNKVCAIDRIHPSHDDSKSVMQASIVSVRVTVR